MLFVIELEVHSGKSATIIDNLLLDVKFQIKVTTENSVEYVLDKMIAARSKEDRESTLAVTF